MENETRQTEYQLEGQRRVFLFLPEGDLSSFISCGKEPTESEADLQEADGKEGGKLKDKPAAASR